MAMRGWRAAAVKMPRHLNRLKTSEGFSGYPRYARARVYAYNGKSLQRSSDRRALGLYREVGEALLAGIIALFGKAAIG
jgi:hypothetical protein